jgi:fructosamine-3-kinase
VSSPQGEHLPARLDEPVGAALRQIGDNSLIRSVRPVGGGCINHAMRLETGQGVYLLKYNSDPLPSMFQCEAEGLRLLAATHSVRIPAALAYEEATGGRPAWILLEFLEGGPSGDAGKLGEQLAGLHRLGVSPHTPPAYGLHNDNYIGSSRQVNAWETDWARFFADYRLRPQMELGQRTGRVSGDRRKRLEKLIERLPGLLSGYQSVPSLIHGDLWGGNVIPGPDGLVLIDPAVSYSDREAELAYTQLFGGFSSRFYAGYNSAWPLDPGYPARRDLYNLYHLLNHLNLFGESYGGEVDQVIRQYV